MQKKSACIPIIGTFAPASTQAAVLTIELPRITRVERLVGRFAFDPSGSALGLPGAPLTGAYLNAGNNHLAVRPLFGKKQIFVGVISGSGARYAAGRFGWDAAGRSITLSAETEPSRPLNCRPVALGQ
ncbi:MAG: MliC family protein [Acetobacteraceae bacterium]|nr:MliC family protein [Acetobacteraceae bacterium]